MSDTENTPVPADDTEGHAVKIGRVQSEQDDTEGHGFRGNVVQDDQDDVQEIGRAHV